MGGKASRKSPRSRTRGLTRFRRLDHTTAVHGDGQFPIVFGSVSYQIRILLYRDVSGVYLECILMCPDIRTIRIRISVDHR